MAGVPDNVRHYVEKNVGASALFAVVIVGFICLFLQPVAPWLFKWPAALQIPATEWIGSGLGWFLEAFKLSDGNGKSVLVHMAAQEVSVLGQLCTYLLKL